MIGSTMPNRSGLCTGRKVTGASSESVAGFAAEDRSYPNCPLTREVQSGGFSESAVGAGCARWWTPSRYDRHGASAYRFVHTDDDPVPEHVAVSDDPECGDLFFRRGLARPSATRFPAALPLQFGSVLGAFQRGNRRVDHGNASACARRSWNPTSRVHPRMSASA